jgi:hypothetical protein
MKLKKKNKNMMQSKFYTKDLSKTHANTKLKLGNWKFRLQKNKKW